MYFSRSFPFPVSFHWPLSFSFPFPFHSSISFPEAAVLLRNAGSPICKANSFAGLGFLATLWKVVCDCSNLQFELKGRIPRELFAADCSLGVGSLPSVVEEPTPEDNADFWSSALAKDHVQAMAAATAEGNANRLRLRSACGQQSYFRQNICLNPYCKQSFMHMSAEEVGQRLQSWGAAGGNQVATPEQLESARVKRIKRRCRTGTGRGAAVLHRSYWKRWVH